jgi:hypothetical protein
MFDLTTQGTRGTPQQYGLSRGAHFRLLDSAGYYRKYDYYLKKYGAVQYGAEVLKLSGPLPRGALLVLPGGGGSCLYEGCIYFERNTGAT